MEVRLVRLALGEREFERNVSLTSVNETSFFKGWYAAGLSITDTTISVLGFAISTGTAVKSI